jgi:hydrogenase maturation protein HypF
VNASLSEARALRVSGVVQGVGFRPFVYRLAHRHQLTGWVLNDERGVAIHIEGSGHALDSFTEHLRREPPPAARIDAIDVETIEPMGLGTFHVRDSAHGHSPTARISPDIAVCSDCVRELFDPADRRYHYPYINCSNCGPRLSVVLALPYDRSRTTMSPWTLCDACASEYENPANRRFHAQPIACANCGPGYSLIDGTAVIEGSAPAIERCAELLRRGSVLGIKGLGGYHLACDATNGTSVAALRMRKFRKDKPFAVMVRDIDTARRIASLSPGSQTWLCSAARPIVLVPSTVDLQHVAPGTSELGMMLPYSPLHYLLFAAGAPDAIVMTSGNRSSEPIAYEDADARERLDGIADAILVGERAIARRVEDSVVRVTGAVPRIFRRARGYATSAVARLQSPVPILALGADLKNTITLVVGGHAIVSQHLGDLEHYEAARAFEDAARDLTQMYGLKSRDMIVAHDRHPQYASTVFARTLPAVSHRAVQHHRAHVASVLAERGDVMTPCLGIAFDGTGFGDDGTIWGGEFFVGSIATGLQRVAHLRAAALPGGDAAARYPVQAAAGFLAQLGDTADMSELPFLFGRRYEQACSLVRANIRMFSTTSVGRLFDAVAALLGFDGEVTFEGQAAMWLEQLALRSDTRLAAPFDFRNAELDFRPTLRAIVNWRVAGHAPSDIARAFHRGLANGITQAAQEICAARQIDTVVLSGGVFQNELLLTGVRDLMPSLRVWVNEKVPPNDGGISLGQAALAAVSEGTCGSSRKGRSKNE